jgi:hypothetical protein
MKEQGERFTEEILRGISSRGKAQEMIETLYSLISQMSNPLAHGTSSEYLESILEKGLGGFVPKGSFSPNVISVCNPKLKDGLLGAYAFSLRAGILFSSKLSIDARKFGGRNVIKRYVATLGLNSRQAKKAEIQLKIVGLLYCLKRGRMRGWPTLLVYDVKDKIKVEKAPNKIPSDFIALAPLPKEMLSLVLVPAKHYQEIKRINTSFKLNVPILPLEIIELEEILKKGG